MRRIGLLLGAGASAEAGMPLAWDLTAEIKNWLTPAKLRELNAGWRIQGNSYSDKVIDDLAQALVEPKLHYEAILGHLETQFRRHGPHQQEYHGLYSWLIELVSILLVYRQTNNTAFYERHLPLYDGLAALATSDSPLWVFSLNHDLVIEAMAARLSLPLYCGFSPETMILPRRNAHGEKIGEIRAEIIRENDLEHGAMFFPNPLKSGIYLLKVHGSLDSFTFNDGKDVLRLLPDTPHPAAIFETLRAANNELIYATDGWPGGKAKGINEIIYADESGEMQFLRRSLLAGAYKFDDRGNQTLPKSMLRHFCQNLNFVSELVCIGYSFGDIHINQALRKWLEFSANRRLEIVAPGIDAVPRDLLHLASQVILTKSGCTDYLDTRAGIPRTKTEKLEKKIGAIRLKLGIARWQRAMSAFIEADQARLGEALKAKLESLPLKDGAPDTSSLGDPTAIGRLWAAEIGGDCDAALARMLEYLEKSDAA